jgi:hypothetical protein
MAHVHVYFVSYLLGVVADAGESEIYFNEYFREYGIVYSTIFYKAELIQVYRHVSIVVEHGKRDDCTRPDLRY